MNARLIEDVDGKFVLAGPNPVKDTYVVCREPVADAIRVFIINWNRKHASDTGQFASNQQRTLVTQMRAVEWLSRETHLREETIVNAFRRATDGSLRSRTLDLRIADALLTAVGRTDLFQCGDPRLIPRRRAEQRCC